MGQDILEAPVPPLQLTPRTTYIRNDGKDVSIYGLAGVPDIDGQRIWCSVQGDHYAEDGRLVSGRLVPCVYIGVTSRLKYESYLLPADNWRSIREEDTSDEAKSWWDAVT